MQNTAVPSENTQNSGTPKRKGLRKWIRIGILLADLLLLIAAAWAYFHTAAQYKERFLPGTILNGFDVSEKTAEEAEQLLSSTLSSYKLDLVFPDEVTETITGPQIALHPEVGPAVRETLASQNSLAWPGSIFGRRYVRTLSADISFDKDLMGALISAMPEARPSAQTAPKDAYITFGENNRLTIIPEDDGNMIDLSSLISVAENAVLAGKKCLILADTGVYEMPAVRADDPALTGCVEEINHFLDTKITLVMSDGTERTIDDTMLRSWLVLRSNGLYAVDDRIVRQCVGNVVRRMAIEDDSFGQYTLFRSSRLGIVRIPSDKMHGHKLDRDAVTKLAADALLAGRSARIEPVYADYIDDPDPQIGGTYIEIDIFGQHVYYYKNYELDYDTPCVTGTEGSERATPSGMYDIYKKYYDQVLLGPPKEDGTPSYAAPVTYFLAFLKGYGLHDATWRSDSEFGSDRYQRGGSHGCVNLPFDAAKYLYNNVEEKTPVIVFRSKLSAAEEAVQNGEFVQKGSEESASLLA